MTPPSASRIVAAVVCATFAAWFAVGVATQPDREPGHRIEGLVLDGGPTTTGPVGNLPGPVAPIPHRTIEGADK